MTKITENNKVTTIPSLPELIGYMGQSFTLLILFLFYSFALHVIFVKDLPCTINYFLWLFSFRCLGSTTFHFPIQFDEMSGCTATSRLFDIFHYLFIFNIFYFTQKYSLLDVIWIISMLQTLCLTCKLACAI